MNSKNVSGNENILYIVSLIVFFILNYILIGYSVAVIIPTVVIPVFLLGMSLKYGNIKTIIAIIIGMTPFFILNNEARLVSNYLIYILNFIGIKFIYGKRYDKWDNLLILTITSHISVVISLIYTLIKNYGGSLYNYFNEMAVLLKSMAMLALMGNDMFSQADVMEYVNTITSERLSFMYPTMLIASSLLIAYITLRFLHFFVTFEVNKIKVNLVSEIKASPILIMFFMLLSGIGSLLMANKVEIGKYLYWNGYFLLEVLAALIFLSYIVYILSNRFKMKSKLAKGLILFLIMPLMDIDVMILFAILDSIIDFRNLTNYGLKRYYSNKIKKDKEDKR